MGLSMRRECIEHTAQLQAAQGRRTQRRHKHQSGGKVADSAEAGAQGRAHTAQK